MYSAGADITRFIKLFDEHGNEGYFIGEHRSLAAWQSQLRDSFVGAVFEHVDIGPEFDSPEPLIVSYRRNLWPFLKDMLSLTEQKPTLFATELRDPDTKERIFNELWTGDAWLQLQVVE